MKRTDSIGWAIVACVMTSVIAAQQSHAEVTYYGGGWSVNGFGGPVSGNAFAQFIDNGAQVQLNLDVQGPSYFGFFGTVSPSVLELVGTRNADQSITFNPISGHPTYGSVSAVINPAGAISMQWSNMPMNDSITAGGPVTGVISPTILELDFSLQANTGIIAIFPGSIDMRSVPEPAMLSPVVVFAVIRRRRSRGREAS